MKCCFAWKGYWEKQTNRPSGSSYLEKGSQQYIYALRSKDLPREMEKLGQVYYTVYSQVKENKGYQGRQELINFERVYRGHFVVVGQVISARSPEELHGGMLQSPDDPEATYRKKGDQSGQGYVINGTETGHPDNPIQLVTDIAVAPNNMDDSQVLNIGPDGNWEVPKESVKILLEVGKKVMKGKELLKQSNTGF